MWLVAIGLCYLIWRVEQIRRAVEARALNDTQIKAMPTAPHTPLWAVLIKEGKHQTLLTIEAPSEGVALGIVTKQYPRAAVENIQRAKYA